MINVIDLVLGIFIAMYFFKNSGGVPKTIKNVLLVALFLMGFALLSQLVLNLPIAEKIQPTFEESYLVKVSHQLVKWVYPAVEKSAPNVDAFIKKEIIAKPDSAAEPPKVDLPNAGGPLIMIPKDKLPKLDVKDLPRLGE